jgi:hypothetical protein
MADCIVYQPDCIVSIIINEISPIRREDCIVSEITK